MTQVEIDSFISKFKHLLSAGLNATLKLDACNGCAHVTLSTDLTSSSLGPSLVTEQCTSRKAYSSLIRSRGPSYNRRQIRRRKAETDNNVDKCSVTDDSTAEQAVEIERSDVDSQATVKVEENSTKVRNPADQADMNLMDDGDSHDNSDVVISDVLSVNTEEVIVKKEQNEETSTQCVNDTTAAQKDFTDDQIVVVHATGVVENSPYSKFDGEEWVSMLRFIGSKDHLKKNIVDVRKCHSKSIANGDKFKHVVGLEIIVNAKALWETPRSYLFRHVGQDIWERGNGSSITLTKIHQK